MSLSRRNNVAERASNEEFIARLVSEWQNPQEGQIEPVIIEEAPDVDVTPRHLYVVWSIWDTLTPLERSRIVLQAYERFRGREAMLDVTVAMGLTPEEATRIGIQWK